MKKIIISIYWRFGCCCCCCCRLLSVANSKRLNTRGQCDAIENYHDNRNRSELVFYWEFIPFILISVNFLQKLFTFLWIEVLHRDTQPINMLMNFIYFSFFFSFVHNSLPNELNKQQNRMFRFTVRLIDHVIVV